ncbi:efflux RND transporter periplasmic adaptor subunit [Bradyrhizobium sp. WSM1253]|uniref:efflux RND transporter periplasmic adaptor subunit n=1 Tax=Bradyrhizobium sp. WSM1253 TaxID=319003 RepID=UPI00025D2874|nr:RND family efflux transporter, MFP subunit [Bradyrhizobium sp. WSM1253]
MRGRRTTSRQVFAVTLIASVFAPFLVACGRQAETKELPPRPVRTTTIEKRDSLVPLIFTGRIEAEDEVAVAFRISGRLRASHAKLGDRVEAGQLLAQLESQNELSTLRQAKAALSAAQGQLTQARNHYERQETLLAQGWTTRANFEAATQARQAAQSQVEAAEAQVDSAHDLVSFTELRADAPGKITATGPSDGEVVQAGQMIARIARQDGRDAVFDVPAQMIRSTPADVQVMVSLTDDAKITAQGRVRQVAAQADPVTRTFEVKVGLTDPPPAMRLGATVNGRVELGSGPVIDVPATALTRINQQPAVWILDPQTNIISARNVDILRFDQTDVIVSQGLNAGDIVVTAGVQALHPGQKVRVLGSEP